MSGITFNIQIIPAGRFLGGIQAVLENPMGGGRSAEVTRALRESVAREFAAGAHSLPSGGTRPWKENVAFGTRELPSIPLGGPSGSIASAWAGSSTGGFVGLHETSPERVAIGVSHPAAEMHRGGQDGSEGSTTMVLTHKAAAFLRHAYEVDTEGGNSVTIPARPHGTTNPGLEASVVAIFQRAFGGSK